MRYRVLVKLKEGVLDVQGKAIESGLSELGVQSVSDVRVGKVVEFSVKPEDLTSGAFKEDDIQKLCNDLFSNPVIEDYSVEEVR